MPKDDFSLAGLVVVYARIHVLEDNSFEMRAIDNYQYALNDFAKEICRIKRESDDDLSTTEECFLIVGLKDRLTVLEKVVRSSIKAAFDQMDSGDMLNIAFKQDTLLTVDLLCKLYLQLIIRHDKLRFPLSVCKSIGDEMDALCLYSSEGPDSNSISADIAVDMWTQREKPWFAGKQPIIQSFLLRKLEGRRIIMSTPSATSGEWALLLEGGIAFTTNNNGIFYSRSIEQQTEEFTSGYIHAILSNPVYAYGKLYDQEIFREWNLVFLFALAVSDAPVRDSNIMQQLYHNFLGFIEDYISDHTVCPPIIEEHLFLGAYAKMVEEMKSYLKGHEERSITRDVIITMRSRYGYLPYLYEIIQSVCPDATSPSVPCKKTSEDALLKSIALSQSASSAEKGKAFEDLSANFFDNINGLRVMGKRQRGLREEIDLCIANTSLDSELWKMGPLILAECKNWSDKVGVPAIRNFSYVLNAKKAVVGILFTRSGVTSVVKKEISEQALNGQFILIIDESDFFRIWRNDITPKDMLITKYNSLINSVESAWELLF